MLTKEEKKDKERHSQNRKHKTLIKNQFKKVGVYLQEKKSDEKELEKLISETQKVLDEAKNKKVIHKNKSRRKKSRAHKKLNELRKRAEV